MSAPTVTLQQIATAACVGLATVSYGLRDDPRIRPETRAKIKAVARELGYRPNPRFAALMAHIRRAHKLEAGERVAFVWVHTTRHEASLDKFLQPVLSGARERAERLGYALDEYWTDGDGMTDRRLSDILKARGVTGVVFSPVIHEAEVSLNFDWSQFAPAVIGHARWKPELHHATHHHYLAMRLALENLARQGCRRPVAMLEAGVNERGQRAWQAAFLVFHREASRAARYLWMEPINARKSVQAWMDKARGDSLIVSSNALVDRLKLLGVRLPAGPIVTLSWSQVRPEIGGIDQQYDLIAANAVDLVVSQLSSNETGVPAMPRLLQFPGRWVDAVTTPAVAASSLRRVAAGRPRPVRKNRT